MNKSAPTRLHVLVVDDEPLIRWSLSETLLEAGHSVEEAADGRDALARIANATRTFDAILLDYRLPDSNDLGLLGQIRHLVPSAVVIMMTAFGTAEVADGALALGAYRVVPKPFEVHEIADLVVEAHTAALRAVR
jgi:DNA-binding NtrC family response regulator